MLARQDDSPLWIADARLDERLATLACVTGRPGVRWLASIPFGADGAGQIELFGTQVQEMPANGIRMLSDLRHMATQYLVLQQRARRASEGEAFFRLLAENSTDTIVHGDLEGTRRYVSPSVKTLLGYEPAELIGKKAITLTHPDDIPAFGEVLRQVREKNLDVGVIEMRQRHADGSWVWMEAQIKLVRDSCQEITGYVASVRAIGKRKDQENQLTRLASYDSLTDLPNRAFFERFLSQEIARIDRGVHRLVLLYMDVDGFKQVNDSLGHLVGDWVLRELAMRFRSVLRSSDIVARLGGDEFTAIIQVEQLAEGLALAERLIASVAIPFRHENADIRIGLSVGIARVPEDGVDPRKLMSRADQALYEAKRRGRNTFAVFGM